MRRDVRAVPVGQAGARAATPPLSRQVRYVESWEELVSAQFDGEVNALCWKRTLDGDFDEVMTALGGNAGVVNLGDAQLGSLRLSPAGQAAVSAVLNDVKRLEGHGLEPELNYISTYPRDQTSVVATDVYSFHVDRAPRNVDTWLCTYSGAATQGLDNADAMRCVDIPERRQKLLQVYGGADDGGFRRFLRDGNYDLHYTASSDTSPWCFGVSHLWRVATLTPERRTKPCIHRAPPDVPGQARLLLIA